MATVTKLRRAGVQRRIENVQRELAYLERATRYDPVLEEILRSAAAGPISSAARRAQAQA